MLTQEQKTHDQLDTQEATKTCTKCKRTLPLSQFYVHKRDGYRSCCKDCSKILNNESHKKLQKKYQLLREDNNYSIPEIKFCKKCSTELPISEFPNNKLNLDGKSSWCKKCMNLNTANYARNNPHYFPKYNLGPGKYTTYAPQISYADLVKEGENGELLAECKFCKTYFAPTVRQLMQRTGALNGRYSGESNLYCSNKCKKKCPTYNYKVRGSIDYILANSPTRKREVPRAFISIALADRNYQCEKCGTHLYLHVHHIEGVIQQPMFSCDLLNVLVVCRDCHHEIHSQPGCSYQDYQCANAA